MELQFVPVSQTTAPSSSPTLQNPHTFDLVYTQGKNLPFSCTSVQTTIRFVCDITQGRGAPVSLQVNDRCQTVFQWASVYACHKCQESEIVIELGACVDGTRIVTYKYNIPCFGLPPAATHQDCQDVSLAKKTAIIAVTSVAIVVVVGLAGYDFLPPKKEFGG